MLKVNHIDAYYGKVQALHDVSLEVGGDEIISLIGANGAGKKYTDENHYGANPAKAWKC